MQIQYFRKNLIDYTNDFWSEFIYKIGTRSTLDEITLLLYFNITWYIQLESFDDWVDRIFWLNNAEISFSIKILQRFYDDFTKVEWISFDEKSWKVSVNWDEIWEISIETQPYHFFKYLYDNRWVYKTHNEIKEYVKWKDKIEKWDDEFCRTIKNELSKNIKDIIKTQKGGYLIP